MQKFKLVLGWFSACDMDYFHFKFLICWNIWGHYLFGKSFKPEINECNNNYSVLKIYNFENKFVEFLDNFQVKLNIHWYFVTLFRLVGLPKSFFRISLRLNCVIYNWYLYFLPNITATNWTNSLINCAGYNSGGCLIKDNQWTILQQHFLLSFKYGTHLTVT